MSFEVVRETVDYTWVVARQLDRVAEAASRLDPSSTGSSFRIGLIRYAVALRELYVLVAPLAEKHGIKLDFGGSFDSTYKCLLRGGCRLASAWQLLDAIQARLIEALYLMGMLVRVSRLAVEE